jgi:hypothetical protein
LGSAVGTNPGKTRESAQGPVSPERPEVNCST